jgi:bifunctional UDP-N-acetylglucosamine pyrophosphorylase/glucosamine-1-phosphate N-acetyltransferase/UDP-N-acetylglucosamine pyrophosphorylase
MRGLGTYDSGKGGGKPLMNQPLAIVLAAGKGTRMESDLPKVLVSCLGRPLIEYVLDALRAGGIQRTLVVVGYRAEDVRQALSHHDHLTFVEQTEQLGTGHAVAACREHLEGHQGAVLVLAGDSPMTQGSSIAKLLELYHRDRPACILGTAQKDDPRGLGRIVRGPDGQFEGIVEEKDATPQQRQIREVNMSTYVFDGPSLCFALQRLDNNNASGEYYLTDCPGILRDQGWDVRASAVLQPCEALSVNNLAELRAVEAEMKNARLDERTENT